MTYQSDWLVGGRLGPVRRKVLSHLMMSRVVVQAGAIPRELTGDTDVEE